MEHYDGASKWRWLRPVFFTEKQIHQHPVPPRFMLISCIPWLALPLPRNVHLRFRPISLLLSYWNSTSLSYLLQLLWSVLCLISFNFLTRKSLSWLDILQLAISCVVSFNSLCFGFGFVWSFFFLCIWRYRAESTCISLTTSESKILNFSCCIIPKASNLSHRFVLRPKALRIQCFCYKTLSMQKSSWNFVHGYIITQL